MPQNGLTKPQPFEKKKKKKLFKFGYRMKAIMLSTLHRSNIQCFKLEKKIKKMKARTVVGLQFRSGPLQEVVWS